MPAAIEYDYKEVDNWSEAERRARDDYIAAAWQYFKGNQKKPLRVKAGQIDDNIIVNVSKILINRSVSLLFGKGVDFQVDDDPDRNEVEVFLNAVWNGGSNTDDMNEKMLLLNDIALNGYITGTPAVKIMTPDFESGQELPRIINLDPRIVTAFWKSDDISSVLWYSIFWNKTRRQDIVRSGDIWIIFDIEREEVITATSQDTQFKYRIVNEQEWPYSWSPILTWKNLPAPNEFYAESDIDHANLNDPINFQASNINRILQKFAHPKTVGIGFSVGEVVPDEVGGLLTINKRPDEVQISNLEMVSDLQSSLQWYQELKSVFFSLGASVDMSTVRDRIGQITNFGLLVLFKDALDRLTVKRALYGGALATINRRLAEIGGFGDDVIIKNIWPDPLPANMVEQIEGLERQRNLGIISKETAARELGRDWELEQELLADEETTGDLGTQILNNLRFNRGQ